MTKEELETLEKETHKQFLEILHKLRTEYALKNAKYKVGDFIRSITGIIKIDDIIYQTKIDELGIHTDTYIAYCGYKYTYDNHLLYKSSNEKQKVCFVDYDDNLELVTNPNPF